MGKPPKEYTWYCEYCKDWVIKGKFYSTAFREHYAVCENITDPEDRILIYLVTKYGKKNHILAGCQSNLGSDFYIISIGVKHFFKYYLADLCNFCKNNMEKEFIRAMHLLSDEVLGELIFSQKKYLRRISTKEKLRRSTSYKGKVKK